MYGYVRPSADRLTVEETELFQAAYCGLCHTMGRRYGFLSRFFLNYDFTFLAILLAPATQRKCCRCIAAPCKGRHALQEDEPLELAADCTVILAWWQLRDGVADSGWLRGLRYRFFCLLLRRAYRRAAALRPAFDRAARDQLRRLAALEEEGCPNLDQPADTFAMLLAGVAEEVDDPVRRRILFQLFYHLGRWVYLVDAADDLKKDSEKGDYNPLIWRFHLENGDWNPEAKKMLGITLDQSIRQMAAAFELWDFGPWAGIIRSTLYEGLYSVGYAVLEGRFHSETSRFHFRRGHKEIL